MTDASLDALHDWLRIGSGQTAAKLFADLERIRRLKPGAWDELPKSANDFVQGLNDLAVRGLAEKSGQLWLWLPKAAPVPKKEATLF